MRLRAVFLDLYGTLMDPESDRRAHRGMVEALDQRFHLGGDVEGLGGRLDAHRDRYFRHPRGYWTGREVIEEATLDLLREFGIRPGPEDMAWWRDLYVATHRQHLRLYPDAEDFLGGLLGLPLHRGLISDIDADFLPVVRGALGLDRYLHSYTSSEEAGATKPSPKPFMAALAKAAVAPGEAIHVGDLPHRDVEGARAVGMRTILRLRPGMREGPEADHVVSDLREALPIIRGYMGDGA